VNWRLSPFAPDESQKEEQENRAQKGANQVADHSSKRNPQQTKDESTQQRTDDSDNKIAHEAEAVTLDHCARQKSGGESDKNEPEPIFHRFNFPFFCKLTGSLQFAIRRQPLQTALATEAAFRLKIPFNIFNSMRTGENFSANSVKS